MYYDARMGCAELMRLKQKGLRNGNWFRLGCVERGLFRCALWLVRIRGQIKSMKLQLELSKIIVKLKATIRMHMLQAGAARAKDLLDLYSEKGVFSWARQVKDWLWYPKVIFYLGVVQLYSS